jgi:hypothetical protein
MKDIIMDLNYENVIGKSGLSPASSAHAATREMPGKAALKPHSFSDLLKHVSGNPETDTIRPEKPGYSLNKEEAIVLCQRVAFQMNESLLAILSDGEEKSRAGTSLLDGFGEMLSRKMENQPSLSKTGQAASEKDLLKKQSRMPDPMIENAKKTDMPVSDVPDSGLHDIEEIIRKAAKTHGVDAELIRSVIQAESNFNSNAVSPKGAEGLMQLMPGTAKELGVTDAFHPVQNIMGGTRYLKQLLDRYDQNVPLALAAYNWGMGNVDSQKRPVPAETRNYVAKITGVSLS